MLVSRHNYLNKKVELDIPVTKKQIIAWQNGAHIQTVMPELTADQREFLISGTMPGEWDEIFEEEE